MTILWLTLFGAVVSMLHICVGQARGIWVSGDHGIIGSTTSGDETHRPPLNVAAGDRRAGLSAGLIPGSHSFPSSED
jgi:hypothetical protein